MALSGWRRLAQKLISSTARCARVSRPRTSPDRRSPSSSAHDRRRRKHRRDFYRPRLEALEERALLVLWDGGALFNDNWSDATNWKGDVAPVAGGELFFPDNVSLSDRSTNNDFPIGTLFNKITISGRFYKLDGNRITLGSGGLLQQPFDVLGEDVTNTIKLSITLPSGSTVVEVKPLTPTSNSKLILEGGLFGAGGITKVGSGTLSIEGSFSNGYSGVTRINQGILFLNKSGVAVPGNLIIGDSVNSTEVRVLSDNQIADTSFVTINKGGALFLENGASDAIGPLTMLESVVETGSGKLTVKGDVAVQIDGVITGNLGLGNPVVKFTVNKKLTVNAAISGTGILEKNGIGELLFTGSAPNTYTGETRLFAGILSLQKAAGVNAIAGRLVVGDGVVGETVVLRAPNQIPNTAAVIVNNLGGLQMDFSDTIGPLTLNGGKVFMGLNTVLTLNGTLTSGPSDSPALILGGQLDPGSSSRLINVVDGPAAQDLIISAKIIGANSGLNKFNSGTLVLTKENTQGQATTLDGGTLLVNNAHLNAPVFVNGSLAVLGGTGTIAGVRMNGGTIDPGESPGILTVNSLGAFAGSLAKFRFEINGPTAGTEFDQLRVTSANIFGVALDLSGNPTLNVVLGSVFFPALGTQFKIVDIVGPTFSPAKGVFKSPQGVLLTEGSALTVNGQTFVISYVGGDGNDVVLTRDDPPAFQNRSVTPFIQEGGIATLKGTITEPNAGDTFFLDVNWGDGSAKETFTFPPGSPRNVSVTHRYLDNPSEDRYTIRLLWRDQHGGSNTGTLPIVVRNVAPTLSNLTIGSPVVPGQLATFSGLISDPGVRDTFNLRVVWGDGSPPETFNFPAGTTSFSLTHRFTRAGNHTITLVLKDDDNGVKVATTRVKVNPSAAVSSIGYLANGEGEAFAPLNPAAVNALFAQEPPAFVRPSRGRGR